MIDFIFFQAESKGATATEYGIVFGSYELTMFIVSPLVGKIVNIQIFITLVLSFSFLKYDKSELVFSQHISLQRYQLFCIDTG